MIQDIFPYKYDCTFRGQSVCDDDYILIFDDREVYFTFNMLIPTYKQVSRFVNKESLVYLFSVDNHGFYCSLDRDIISEDIFTKANVDVFRELKPQWMAFAMITGFHLYNWYTTHKYCGKCGSPMTHSKKERAMICDKCGNMNFPQISPAVIVGVIDNDRILLTKYSNREYKKYALIAGFTEIGETVEETVKREVMEEAGLKVKNIRYFDNQPWGLSGSLLLGFFADLDGDSTINLDEEELSEGIWVSRDDMNPTDNSESLTNTMIEAFRNKLI